MTPRLPVVTGKNLVRALEKRGWRVFHKEVLRDLGMTADDLRAFL